MVATISLKMESGRLFHQWLLNTDKDSPSLSSTGLIEIRVGMDEAMTSMTRIE